MSTYLYLQCLDHEPPLTAHDESGQHLYDLPQIRADIANRDSLVGRWNDDSDEIAEYFRRHTVAFLAQHPKCRINIRDEYGRDHPITEQEKPDA